MINEKFVSLNIYLGFYFERGFSQLICENFSDNIIFNLNQLKK